MSQPFWHSRKMNFVDNCYGFSTGTICSGVANVQNPEIALELHFPTSSTFLHRRCAYTDFCKNMKMSYMVIKSLLILTVKELF
jgi:hypothetical protein